MAALRFFCFKIKMQGRILHELKNFEPDIDEKILLRGKKYFADGLVSDLWTPNSGCYHAVVEGSISYDVEIHVGEGGEISSHICDCPYDWGNYCKHEVAVLFAIREHLQQGATLKRKGQKQGLRSLLLRQSKNTLVSLLCDLAVKHDLREDIVYHLENV